MRGGVWDCFVNSPFPTCLIFMLIQVIAQTPHRTFWLFTQRIVLTENLLILQKGLCWFKTRVFMECFYHVCRSAPQFRADACPRSSQSSSLQRLGWGVPRGGLGTGLCSAQSCRVCAYCIARLAESCMLVCFPFARRSA